MKRRRVEHLSFTG